MARILAVEDEALVRMLIVQTLEDEGHAVLEAGDGETALSIVEAEKDLDLIVTDVRMPRLGGYELAFAVRELRPATRFIFMTGYSKEDLPEELSASRFLQKPFDPEHLAEAVDALLARREGTGQPDET